MNHEPRFVKLVNPQSSTGTVGSIQSGMSLSIKNGDAVRHERNSRVGTARTNADTTKDPGRAGENIKKTSLSNQEKGSKQPIEKQDQKARCYHYGFASGALVQEMIQYACEISNYDQDFILTINSENGAWNLNAVNHNKNGTYDKGLCQFNSAYYSSIIKDKRFSDRKFQIDNCYTLYKNGTRFYGFDHRYQRAKGLVLVGDKRF